VPREEREEPAASRLAVFGATLRLIRIRVGMTQLELGNAAGMARTYINELETGSRNPTYLALWQLSSALGVSPRSFFPKVERPDPLA